MEAERQQSVVSSLPILAMVAIMAGAYYVSRLPLQSSRPESPLGLEHVMPERDKIDARLWQDPIKVALDHERAMHRTEPNCTDPRWVCKSIHCVSQVSDRINDIIQNTSAKPDVTAVHVLLIIVRDGNFAEDHERRLRNRYAVLTALYASGLTPDDSERMQYFKLLWTEENKLEQGIKEKKIPKIIPVVGKEERTIIVPFEWFHRDKLYAIEKTNGPMDKLVENVVCVWLPERAFYHRPLTRLAQVVEAIGHTFPGSVEMDIVGPSYSDTLLTMLKETVKLCGKGVQDVGDGFSYVRARLCGLTIFSPWSTASPALLMREADVNGPDSYDSPAAMFSHMSDQFAPLGVKFLQTIGSDDLLAMELIGELARRGADPISKRIKKSKGVALICESDTFYGKAFPLIFASMMESIDRETSQPDWKTYTKILMSKTEEGEIITKDPLRAYRYIRGVDGQLLQAQVPEEKKTTEKSESESKWTYTRNLELPIGRGQLDYVRRLARDMKDDWRNVELMAIGVVGSDVYDKLILLHALREEFGDVLLFMTDLDARLMHYEQSKWTRNVIVSSGFGFKLNDVYHSGVVRNMPWYQLPPFRDNYQTSLFFACRAALGMRVNGNGASFRYMSPGKLAELLNYPRLFEIGRGCAVDISMYKEAEIHPHVRWVSKRVLLRLAIFIAMALVFCILLLAQINTHVAKVISVVWRGLADKVRSALCLRADRGKRAEDKKEDPLKWGAITTVSILATAVFVVVVIVDHYRSGGEPFSLFAAVSIWPGVALRLIAAVLSVCFIAKSYQDLRKNNQDLDSNFCLDTTGKFHPTTFADWRKSRDMSDRLVSKIRQWLLYRRWIGIPAWNSWDADDTKVDAKELWAGYLNRGSGWNRFHRFSGTTLTYVILAFALMMIFSFPKTPYRGNVSWYTDKILLFASVVSMIFLIFLVVDATRLSIKFVRSLKNPTTIWPDELVAKLRHQTAKQLPAKSGENAESTEDALDLVSDDALSEWLDIKFIACHTQAVGRLIYYPFIILLIMFVARSRYFDHWDFPISLITIFLLNSTLAVCCGCMLRREAENTRQVALDRLQKKLIKATGAGQDRRTRQLSEMIKEIRSIRQGAYSSFTANPVLHAILIPSGGVSLLTLLRFISLS